MYATSRFGAVAAALFLAQFLVISYCERNARACWTLDLRARSPPRLASSLAPRRVASHHVTSRGLVRVQHPRIRFPESARTLHLHRDRSRGKSEEEISIFSSPRKSEYAKSMRKDRMNRSRYLPPKGPSYDR